MADLAFFYIFVMIRTHLLIIDKFVADSIYYKLSSGKPNKFAYYLRSFAQFTLPDIFYRKQLSHTLASVSQRNDYDYILQRVDYYNKQTRKFTLPQKNNLDRNRSWLLYIGRLGDYKRNLFHTTYYIDQKQLTRWFPQKYRWSYLPGDVYFTPDKPTIVKSRLLTKDNTNSILLKLDSLRHFMFVQDKTQWNDKKNAVIFRGKIRQSRLRTSFLEQYFGHPMCDCGVVGKNEGCPQEWMKEKKTIKQHLNYKFIMAIEGNDVSSNLKWVMSSNSLAVMPKPTCETWFMEGKLQGGVHYVEVKDDFSDLETKLNYYIKHPREAEKILENAHRYVSQFLDRKRERLIGLMVLDKYFRLSNQTK